MIHPQIFFRKSSMTWVWICCRVYQRPKKGGYGKEVMEGVKLSHCRIKIPRGKQYLRKIKLTTYGDDIYNGS